MASKCAQQPPFHAAGVPAGREVSPAEPQFEGDAVVGGEVAVGPDDPGDYADDLVGVPGGVGVRHVVPSSHYVLVFTGIGQAHHPMQYEPPIPVSGDYDGAWGNCWLNGFSPVPWEQSRIHAPPDNSIDHLHCFLPLFHLQGVTHSFGSVIEAHPQWTKAPPHAVTASKLPSGR